MATEIGRLVAVIDGDISGLQRAIAGAQKTLQSAGASMTKAGQSLTMGLTLPIIGIGAVAAKASIDFESAFAGVRKTVDATAEQLDKLRTGIRDMAKQMPASAVEISKVAEAAGQLGIRTENILDFTRVMVMLGETTNLTANDAATAMARIANIMQLPQDEFEKLGATLVDLGNKGASTEAEIAEMALRIAGAGTQVGLSADQVLAFANALSSVGIEAQAGGSAISRAFIEMANAVASGGDELDEFARIAGVSAEDFRKAFGDDAATAMIMFMEGLDRISVSGENVFEVLDGLSLGEIRVRDALLRAANAGGLFAQSLKDGKQAWEEGTALSIEYGKRVETTAAKLEIFKNQLNDTMITLGDALVPVLIDVLEASKPIISVIEAMANGFAGLPRPVQMVIVGIAALLAVIGPLLIAIGLMASGVSALIGVLTVFGVVGAGATFSLYGLASGFAALTLAAAPWLVLAIAIGAGLYLLIQNWDAVTAAVSRAASMIRDVAVGAFNTVLSFLRSNWQEVATLVAGPFAPLVALATDAFGVRSALIQAFNEVIGFLRQLPGKIVDAFGSLGDILYNAGQALIMGLWRGMSDVAGKMISWISDLASKISSVFNKALGIFSPSKVMFKIGTQTMAGLGGGLSQGWESYVDPVLGKTIKEINVMSDEWRMANIDAIKALGGKFGFTVFEDASIASPDTVAGAAEIEKQIADAQAAFEEFKNSGRNPGAIDDYAENLGETIEKLRAGIKGIVAEDFSLIENPDEFYGTDKLKKGFLKATGSFFSQAGSAIKGVGSLAGGLGEAIMGIGDSAEDAGEEVGLSALGMSGALDGTTDSVKKLDTEIKGLSDVKVGKDLDKIDYTPVSKLKEKVSEVTATAKDADESIADVQDTVSEDWTAPSIDELTADIDEIGEKAEEQIPSLEAAGLSGENVFEKIGKAAKGLGGNISDAFKSLEGVDLGVDEWIGRAFENLSDLDLGPKIRDLVSEGFRDLSSIDLGVDEWIGRAFENAKTAAASGIESLISSIAANFTAENLGRATAWFLLWPVELFQKAFAIKDAVAGFISSMIVGAFSIVFLEVLPTLAVSAAQFGVGIMSSMASGIRSGTLSIFTFFTVELPAMIASAAVSVSASAVTLGTNIANAIGSALHAAAGVIRTFFLSTLPGFIAESATFVFNAALGLGASVIAGIIEGIKSRYEFIVSVPGEILGFLIDGFNSIKDGLAALGKSISGGIWEGLKDGLEWIGEQIGNFFKGLIEQAAEIIKPGSPSKVFLALGQSVVDGLSKGLEGMQDIDTGLNSLLGNAQRTLSNASSAGMSPRMPSGLWENIIQPSTSQQPGQGGLTIQAYDTVVNNYDEMQDVDKAMSDFAFAAAAQLRYRGYP